MAELDDSAMTRERQRLASRLIFTIRQNGEMDGMLADDCG